MKKIFFCFSFLLLSFGLFAVGSKETDDNVVVVYAYDSFTAEWGPGPELEKQFEAETGYDLQFVTFDDAPNILTQAIADGDACPADVLVGIDNFLFFQAKKAGILEAYKPENASRIAMPELLFDKDFLLTPYDYGYFAFMYDTASKVKAPQRFAELSDPQYAKSLIIMDPRTSTPGLGLLMWTRAVYGDSYLDFWKKLKPSIMLMSPGWSAGYGLFTAGEAPLALSYSSSEAYHVLYDKTERYKALVFDEGHIMQVEGLGLLKNAPHKKAAKAFINFMLSETAQRVLPETQWMYPVALDAPLPASYQNIAVPKKVLQITEDPQNLINAVIDVLK